MRRNLETIWILARKELSAYFLSPVAYVFLVIFLALGGFTTFYAGAILDHGQADLGIFFLWHPWLHLLLVPAIGMSLWAEERRSGSLELLLTQPLTITQAVIGKFLGAWLFLGMALALTFPAPLTMAWLGDPDPGQIVTGYLGSFLIAGVFLAITCTTSALTRNQAVSYILGLVCCTLLIIAGHAAVTDALLRLFPVWLANAIGVLGVSAHTSGMDRGVIPFRDLAYFVTVIGFSLTATGAIVRSRRAG
jgi:ABC-2 type transport system permease protein